MEQNAIELSGELPTELVLNKRSLAKQRSDGLHLHLPAQAPAKYAAGLKIVDDYIVAEGKVDVESRQHGAKAMDESLRRKAKTE